MSGIVNKVKDAIRGDKDTEDSSAGRHGASGTDHSKYGDTGSGRTGEGYGTGQHGTSGTDASRYGETGQRAGDNYGTGQHGGQGSHFTQSGQTGRSVEHPPVTSKNHPTIGTQSSREEPGNFMGAGQLNPSSNTGTSAISGSQGLPGSFPGEQSNVSSHHRDGREYVPPQGTAVGAGTSEYDQARRGQGGSGYDQTGRGQTGSGYDQTGRGQTGSGYDRAEQAVTGRDTTGNYGQSGSGLSGNRGNVDDRDLMDPASRDSHSNVMGGAAAGTAGAAGVGGLAHSGRGDDSGRNKLHKRDDPRGQTGYDDSTSRHTGGHHGHHGERDTQGTHGTHSTQGASGITGTSGTSGTHRETIGGEPYERQGVSGRDQTSGGHHRGAEAAAAAAGAGAGGIGGSQLADRSRHGDGRSQYPDTTDRTRTGGTHDTSLGSRDNPVGSNTSGRDYDDNQRGGVYNTVTGAGSDREREREGIHGHHKHGHGTSGITSGSGAVPREAGDSRLGTGTGTGRDEYGSGVGREYDSSRTGPGHSGLGAGAAGLGAGAGAGALAGHHGDRERDRVGQQGYGTTSGGYGSEPIYHDTTTRQGLGSSDHPSSLQSPGTTGGVGGPGGLSGSGASGGYGPGHDGAKVMHQCNHCGKDNDISHYFKKDTVYRIGQQ